MHESEIIIKLTAADPTITSEMLENHMFRVLDAVENHSDAAEGVVVAVDFANRQIELAFSLCHSSQSEAQRKIADVYGLIEAHTPVTFGATSASVRSQGRDERSLTLC